MKVTKRSLAREMAFTLVFEKAFRQEEMQHIIADAAEARMLEEDEFATALALAVEQHLPELDEQISRYSVKWKLARLPKVTLTILRLALCELCYFEDIPTAATINEAVELAKKYSTEEEAAYINGVLGGFVRARDAQNAAQEKSQPESEA